MPAQSGTPTAIESSICAALRDSPSGALRFADVVVPSSMSLRHQWHVFEHAQRIVQTPRSTTWRGGKRVPAATALSRHKSERCAYCAIAPRCGTRTHVCVTAKSNSSGVMTAVGVVRTPSPRLREADQVRAFEIELTSVAELHSLDDGCTRHADLIPVIEKSGVCLGSIAEWDRSLVRTRALWVTIQAFNLEGNPIEKFARIDGKLDADVPLVLSLADNFAKLALGALNGVTVEVTVARISGRPCIRRCFTIAHETDGPWKSWGLPVKPSLKARPTRESVPIHWIADPTGELELAVYRAAGGVVYQHGNVLRPVWAGLIRRAHQPA